MQPFARTSLSVALLAATFATTMLGTSAAEEQAGGLAGDWLSRYTSARTLGLGSAFVAAADDALGILWNPAGLSQLDRNVVAFEHGRLFEDTSLNALSFAVPGSKLPTFGATVVSLGSGEFARTNEMNDPLGTFSEGETAFLFTASKAVHPRFSLGTNLKIVRQSIEEFGSGGVGVDLGALFQVSPAVRVGASALNLGGPSVSLRETAETYPTEFRGGFSAWVFGGRGLVSAQMDGLSGSPVRLHGGAEYWIQPSLALRAGFDDDAPTGGFTYRMRMPLDIHYGVADHDLGLTHRLGVAYHFGGFAASSAADPEVFSPTGTRSVTKIHLKARTKDDAESWSLTIRDKQDVVVREFGGKGLPPAHLLWDGKDVAGLPLPDGIYRYLLVVHDNKGRRVESPEGVVEIATGGPQGTVPVVPIRP